MDWPNTFYSDPNQYVFDEKGRYHKERVYKKPGSAKRRHRARLMSGDEVRLGQYKRQGGGKKRGCKGSKRARRN